MKLQNKVVLITGATSGIGKETAIALAKEGAEVIITTRSIKKGQKSVQEIINESGNEKIYPYYCDLSSFESIKHFTERFKNDFNKLHILINNAGTWETKFHVTKDGIEKNFAVNHLAPFLLTNELKKMLTESAPARIINVSSSAHKWSRLHTEDPEMKNSFSGLKSYGQSKLANILFTKKLAKELKDQGVTVNALMPGFVKTNLFDKSGSFLRSLMSPFMISPKKGAQTTIYLALADEVENITGEYFQDKKVKTPSREALDMEKAEALWEISRQYLRAA